MCKVDNFLLCCLLRLHAIAAYVVLKNGLQGISSKQNFANDRCKEHFEGCQGTAAFLKNAEEVGAIRTNAEGGLALLPFSECALTLCNLLKKKNSLSASSIGQCAYLYVLPLVKSGCYKLGVVNNS